MGAWHKGVLGLGTHVIGTNAWVRGSTDIEYLEIAEDMATSTSAHTVYVGM